MELAESTNTPIPGGKVVNIAYLLILSTGGMEKSCKQWEDMQVGLGSLEDNYFKGQRQTYINYANRTLAVLIQHLDDDHGTI